MPREAKLGLVIGVGLVILVAVVFFRKDAAHARAGDATTVAARPAGALPVVRAGKKHVVKDGETLFGLAQQYYQDSTRFVELYRANNRVLKTPEKLPAGTVLLIPDLATGRP